MEYNLKKNNCYKTKRKRKIKEFFGCNLRLPIENNIDRCTRTVKRWSGIKHLRDLVESKTIEIFWNYVRLFTKLFPVHACSCACSFITLFGQTVCISLLTWLVEFDCMHKRLLTFTLR